MFFICKNAKELIIRCINYKNTGGWTQDNIEYIHVKEGDAIEVPHCADIFPAYFREATGAESVLIYGKKTRCIDLSGKTILAIQITQELDTVKYNYAIPIKLL